MATAKRKTQTELGLGHRHRCQADSLRHNHTDGTFCDWCGRPMFRDRTKNWDYDPRATNPISGVLQADHSKMSRAEAIRRGLPIPLPDRLLHGECNRQRGDGTNDHLAASSSNTAAPMTTRLYMPWPVTFSA